jgi:hypothetical protein
MLYCSELKKEESDVEGNRKMRNDGSKQIRNMWKLEAGNKETEEKKD